MVTKKVHRLSELKTKLAAYGVDVAETMDRFVGDEELYVSCLHLFFDDENFTALRKALDEKAYGQVFDCAHSLKGVTANLGLTPLFHAICELVESLRNQIYSHVEEQYQAIMEERDRCKAQLL